MHYTDISSHNIQWHTSAQCSVGKIWLLFYTLLGRSQFTGLRGFRSCIRNSIISMSTSDSLGVNRGFACSCEPFCAPELRSTSLPVCWADFDCVQRRGSWNGRLFLLDHFKQSRLKYPKDCRRIAFKFCYSCSSGHLTRTGCNNVWAWTAVNVCADADAISSTAV